MSCCNASPVALPSSVPMHRRLLLVTRRFPYTKEYYAIRLFMYAARDLSRVMSGRPLERRPAGKTHEMRGHGICAGRLAKPSFRLS